MNDLSTGPRDSLRARIEAAERRNAERSLADQARAAAQAASDYTRAHPLTVVGGALAVGLLLGLATRPGRRIAARAVGAAGSAASGAASNAASGVKDLAARGGSRIGALLGEAALAYGMQLIEDMLETGRAGQERIGAIAEDAGTAARKTRERATNAVRSAVKKTSD